MLYSQSTEKHDCIILFYKKEIEIVSHVKNVLVYCCKLMTLTYVVLG